MNPSRGASSRGGGANLVRCAGVVSEWALLFGATCTPATRSPMNHDHRFEPCRLASSRLLVHPVIIFFPAPCHFPCPLIPYTLPPCFALLSRAHPVKVLHPAACLASPTRSYPVTVSCAPCRLPCLPTLHPALPSLAYSFPPCLPPPT